MDTPPVVTAEMMEQLASVEHDRWSGWMKYMFSKGTFNSDGTWTMPKWAVERWVRQMSTPYENLSAEEKESDRVEVRKTLAVLEKDGAKQGST